MVKFLLKRLLYFIPVLAAITFLSFILSTLSPTDPLNKILTSEKSSATGSNASSQMQKQFWIKKLGLDLPLFYFSMQPLSYPSTIHTIYDKRKKNVIEKLINQTGNANAVMGYLSSVTILLDSTKQNKSIHSDAILQTANVLQFATDENECKRLIAQLNSQASQISGLHVLVNKVAVQYKNLSIYKTQWKNYVPAIRYHAHNRFHQWLFGNNLTDEFKSKGIIRGDFGVSFTTREPVWDIVKRKSGWTIFFSLGSVLLAYLISIPTGIFIYLKQETFWDKWITRICFGLFSTPAFLIAILLIYTFANPDVLKLFPSSGVKPSTGFANGESFFEKITAIVPYLVLPMICYTYSSFAFLTLLVKNLLKENAYMQYMITARAKGLSLKEAVYKHALKNALLPLITIFSNVFPSLLAGSVIIETIFTIPGMGYETWYAITNQDYPFIHCIVLLTGVITVVGFLLTDVIYYLADPRISISGK